MDEIIPSNGLFDRSAVGSVETEEFELGEICVAVFEDGYGILGWLAFFYLDTNVVNLFGRHGWRLEGDCKAM